MQYILAIAYPYAIANDGIFICIHAIECFKTRSRDQSIKEVKDEVMYEMRSSGKDYNF